MQRKRDILVQQFLLKQKPLNVTYGIGKEEHDKEGRVITFRIREILYGKYLYSKFKKGIRKIRL